MGVYNVPDLFDKTWHHIAIVRKGSYLYAYKDGNRVGSDNAGFNTSFTLGDWWIATEKGANKYFLNGTIDEFRIYDRALSGAEINETYKGKMKVRLTVRNIGSVKIPEAEFVANLNKDGITVDSDTYTTSDSIDTDEFKTLTFYFNEMEPGKEYNVNIPGIDVSQTVSCQSLE